MTDRCESQAQCGAEATCRTVIRTVFAAILFIAWSLGVAVADEIKLRCVNSAGALVSAYSIDIQNKVVVQTYPGAEATFTQPCKVVITPKTADSGEMHSHYCFDRETDATIEWGYQETKSGWWSHYVLDRTTLALEEDSSHGYFNPLQCSLLHNQL